jgi:hypothetical protein
MMEALQDSRQQSTEEKDRKAEKKSAVRSLLFKWPSE